MNAQDIVSLYYIRQIRNGITGLVETSNQSIDGVRQDLAKAHALCTDEAFESAIAAFSVDPRKNKA